MKRIPFGLLICILLLISAHVQATDEKVEESYIEKARKMYEQYRSDNKEVAEDTKEWIKKDLEKIGDWEYRIIHIAYVDLDKTEEKLNELGRERWECFWVEQRKDSLAFFFKRPKISYLQKIPKGDLLKLFGNGNGN